VFPARYELNFCILFTRNTVFKVLATFRKRKYVYTSESYSQSFVIYNVFNPPCGSKLKRFMGSSVVISSWNSSFV
jgi:hypothetical protein